MNATIYFKRRHSLHAAPSPSQELLLDSSSLVNLFFFELNFSSQGTKRTWGIFSRGPKVTTRCVLVVSHLSTSTTNNKTTNVHASRPQQNTTKQQADKAAQQERSVEKKQVQQCASQVGERHAKQQVPHYASQGPVQMWLVVGES
jgi:hypothetical protein